METHGKVDFLPNLIETHPKVKLFVKPDDDGVNVLVPALHPRQAPHPDHVGIQVDL